MRQEVIFPCERCGGKLTFSAVTGKLTCSHCGHVNIIEQQFSKIFEKDYDKAVAELKNFAIAEKRITSLKCPSCAAVFELNENTHASVCPYCGSGIVNETELYRPIKAQALLPFKITRRESEEIFQKWLKSRWFAPEKLKRYSGADSRLVGVYAPYWTYDSNTHSLYNGRRGVEYQVRQQKWVRIKGQQRLREVTVTRVRWSDVSGTIDQSFDDILVIASTSIPYQLEDWDLENLVDYNEAYLSGFESEVYGLELESGFQKAKEKMQQAIRRSVRRQIGGDRQQITSLRSDYFDTTFKLVLLPVYTASFTFNGKNYQYVINGRSGEIIGKHPYSFAKILMLVLAVAGIVIAIAYYAEHGY